MEQSFSKRLNALIFIFLTVLFADHLCAQPAGYELVWHDEFDGTELDATKWRHRGLGARRGGTVVEDAVSMDGQGHLLITTTILDSSHYYVGMIGTQETFNTTFGYFECRAKFGKGVPWNSFWLQCPTAYQPGPPKETGAEIDIFEFTGHKHSFLGYDVPHNIHWVDKNGNWQHWGSHNAVINDIDGYHTIAVEWTPDWYIFYVNGVFTHIATKGVSHVDEYIILSEEPRFWEDLPDSIRNGATVQDTFFVDYVRVYQKKPAAPVEEREDKTLQKFALEQNYPNPFNPVTTIPFSISVDDFVTLKVYDMMGQEAATLVNEHKKAGAYAVPFDATDLPSGVYYYKLVVGSSFSKSRKMLLVR